MSEDFYCEEVLSGNTLIERVFETQNVLAFHHTRPFYPIHIVVIPKKHIPSLIAAQEQDHDILVELLGVVKTVATQVTSEHGACRVITNMGKYQDSKHLHWHVTFGPTLK